MQRQQVITGFVQTPIRLGVDRFQKRLEFAKDFLRSFDSLNVTKTCEQTRDLAPMTFRELAFDVSFLVDQATLDDRVGKELNDRAATSASCAERLIDLISWPPT